MIKQWFDKLVSKYLADTVSDEERQLLDKIWNRMAENEPPSISEHKLLKTQAESWEQMSRQIQRAKQRRRFATRLTIAVTAVGLIFMVSLLVLRDREDNQSDITATALKSEFGDDVAPGGLHGILTLQNGKFIRLDSVANGTLVEDDSIKITKPHAGLLVCERAQPGRYGNGIRSIVTPRGGVYQVILQEGSRIWLNSASSLTFTAIGSDLQRELYLKGEACFRVTSVPGSTFKVAMERMAVEVKGTYFNLRHYEGDSTTAGALLEGSVVVKPVSARAQIQLTPGKQLLLDERGQVTLEQLEDSLGAIAWKNGLFSFNDTPIEKVMQEVERWYDVEVVYKGKSNDRFNGEIGRDIPLSKLLSFLTQSADIRFEIKGRQLIVNP